MSSSSKRLDIYLVDENLVRSRSEAKDYISRGRVLVNGQVASKAGLNVKESDQVEVNHHKGYVSRSAEKLDVALDEFKIDVKGKTAVDVGASTGGFTQVLLRRDAARVYCIDVGHGQLVEEIKEDPRVVNFEKVNAKNSFRLPSKVNFFVADVSFISLTQILPQILEHLAENTEGVILVKPQFEAAHFNFPLKQGIVESESDQLALVNLVMEEARSLGFKVMGKTHSQVMGKEGNQEFLVHLSL